MKQKIILLTFIITAFFYFFVSPAKSLALCSSPAGCLISAHFGSNNRSNIHWEVGFRAISDFDKSPQNWSFHSTYTLVVKYSGLGCGYNNCAGGDINPAPGSPEYGVQWGTACIDPKVDTTSISGAKNRAVVYDTGNINITDGKGSDQSDLDWYSNNGGGTVQFGGYSSTRNCPRKPAPSYYEISGKVFIDKNGNGVLNNGEPGYSGGAKLHKSGDSNETDTSDGNGNYRFFNLPARDNYRVSFDVPGGGWQATSDTTLGPKSLPPSKTWNFGIIQQSRPDLVVTAFTYPGGNQNQTSDAVVKIKNQGDDAVTGTFNVTVSNGNGTKRTHKVTVNLSAKEDLDMSGATEFKNMPRPNAGNYTATATVDSGDDINESNEGNNVRRDDYRTTAPLSDLRCSSFAFPGGNTAGTSDPTVIIQNIGSIPVNNNFNVRVNNGKGGVINHTVSQSIAVGSTLNLSSFFTNMPIPNPGNYTAVATIDTADNVNEEDEGNNTCTDKYRSTNGPATFNITGGIFNDNKPKDSQKEDAEDYVNGTVHVIGPVGYTPTNPTSDASGFSVTGLLPGKYTISMPNIPAGYSTVTYPTGIGTPQFTVTVGTAAPNTCDTGAHAYASCNAGDVLGLDFGVYLAPFDPWYQGLGGDLRSDSGLQNKIPPGLYFSDSNSQLSPGVVFGFDLGASDQSSKASPNHWFIAGSKFASGVIKTSYDYVKNTVTAGGLADNEISMFGDTSSPCRGDGSDHSCELKTGLTHGIYKANKKVVLDGQPYTFLANSNYVFLIDDDLQIETNLNVPNTSTVIFIVSGDITVDSSVDHIEGIFSTDKTFRAESATGTALDTPLTIEGNVIANASKTITSADAFKDSRDLGPLNDTTPSVQFIYRPDFVLHAPDLIRYSTHTIQEVAPQGTSN